MRSALKGVSSSLIASAFPADFFRGHVNPNGDGRIGFEGAPGRGGPSAGALGDRALCQVLPRPLRAGDPLRFHMFSMRNECTGMIISGHSTITCCCMATWLLYGNANREDQDTKGVLFYEVARFLATRFHKVRATARQLTTQYVKTPAFDVEEGSEAAPQVESGEELPSVSGVFVQEDRRKTRVAAFLRLNLLRSLCLVAGVVNLCLIVCSFNHYSIDVFMALNFTFGAWCLYHCILSLIWAEKEERDKRQKVALLRSEGVAAGAATDSDAEALSEASTVSSLEGGALVTEPAVKKADQPSPPKENKPGFSAINFPLVRVGVSVVRAIEGL
ncbi:UNVERIFIED_CONTAM: hypothetical protein HHA_246490 [Hammondia hammondi]|eukprot:XP_008883708.1 hypothetical protein HHA_246490 [Hammondia hammondi]